MLVESDKMHGGGIEGPNTPEHSEAEIELKNNARNKRQPTFIQEEVDKDIMQLENKNKCIEKSDQKEADSSPPKKRKLEETESEQKAKKMKLENGDNHVSKFFDLLF